MTDITEHPAAEGTLSLCAVKDCWNKQIVGYSMGPRMTVELSVSALCNAITVRSPVGTIVHSARGSQFRSAQFVATLTEPD